MVIFFVNNDQDDFDEMDAHDDVDETSKTLKNGANNDKVFAPVPEGTRGSTSNESNEHIQY